MTNTGELELKGQQLKYIGKEPINSKNASSVMECHLFCLEHKSKCKSMNVEEVALGTFYPYRCESFDVRNTPAVKPESFRTSRGSNYYEMRRESITETSCQDWKNKGFDKDDFYVMTYSNEQQFRAFCQIEREDGPWLVIQRRTQVSASLSKKWPYLKGGFGKGRYELDQSFWLGNHKIYELVKNKPEGVDLLIEAEDENGNIAIGRYAHFSIGQENEDYRLSSKLAYVSGIPGFETLAGFSFATSDRSSPSAQPCVQSAQTAWWFGGDCNIEIDLNRKNFILWNAFTAGFRNADIVKSTMMIKV